MKHSLIIIGSGPAGLTAAIYAARGNLKPIVIEGNVPGGQLMGTSYVENWPGEEKILGHELMANMKQHAQKFGTQFISETITRVDFSKKPFTLWTDRNNELHADAVIIATGAIHNKLKVPGESEYWGKGVTTCAVCDAAFYPNKKVLIVGGGDTAMEEASFLKKFTNDITIVQIGPKFTASHAMQERVLHDSNIKKIFNSSVCEIKGDGQKVTHAVLKNQKTGHTEEIAVDGIFIAIGLKPCTEVFKGQVEMDEWGYIKLKNGTSTSIPGVFAAGDVYDFKYKQAITAAGSGCKSALDVEQYLKEQNS